MDPKETPVIDATVAKRLADADEAVQKAQKEAADAMARATKAEQEIEVEREDRLVRKHADFIKAELPNLSLAETDAAILRTVEKSTPPDTFKRVVEILKAASAQVAEAKTLTREIGSAGEPVRKANTDFERAVDALVQKGMKPEDAAAQVSRDNPELFDAYRAASSLKV